MPSGQEVFGSLFETGEAVFRQGDAGHEMYLIQSGSVEVRRESATGDTVLAELGEGGFFGELALIEMRPRTATVVATSPTRLVPLSRTSLFERMASDSDVAVHLITVLCDRIRRTTDRLASIVHEEECHPTHPPSFRAQNVGEDPSAPLIDGTFLATYASIAVDAGEAIVREGDEGETLYIVLEGEIEVTRRVDGTERVVARRGRNEIFGETAIVGDGIRTATVSARTDCRLIPISREDFLTRIRTQPELALFVLQVLVARLHLTLAAIDDPACVYEDAPRPLPPRLSADRPLRVAFVSLASCAGCVVSLLDEPGALQGLTEGFEVTYCPLLMYSDEIGQVDVAVIDGAVRTREEEDVLREARENSRFLVAWGTCATHGGVPAMANDLELEELIEESYGLSQDTFAYYLSGASGVRDHTYQAELLTLHRKAGKALDYVRVDYYVPGCPPDITLLMGLLGEMRTGEPGGDRAAIVCRECRRKPVSDRVTAFSMTFRENGEDELCMTSGGTPCMGFLTRGGCGAVCPESGLACWGCRGSSHSALRRIRAGETYEQVMLAAFARRCGVDQEEVRPMLRAMRRRGNTSLGLDQGFVRDESRMR